MNRGQTPTVSCVVTTYNYGRFLAEAIDSVLQQTRPVDQIIVVDDGSTDDSIDVARRYGDRIELLQQKNSGVVVARNNGAARATGEFLFFLDADDVLKPTFVERLLAVLAESAPAVSLAYCDAAFFGIEQGVVRSRAWSPRKLLYRNYVIGSAMMRRSVFERVGGYSSDLNQAASFEDWDLWLSILESGGQGVYVPEVLFSYRLHGKGRNGPALRRRPEMEARLRDRHRGLYTEMSNRLYLAVFQTASRLRNAVLKAPGTGQ